ncbi:hypothetical protein GO755_33485 [Spirosoma sp. HMF4905]|uniref:Uncharacterized protein n=1 Tax=Spirosoma arboris TaxID=2682092 RepID=A0A7K1SMG4_9BACT|nr:hypothetical protein [Spirosoma arboris]MVM34989.1 hypothetical protein [Spirosoma arboris]
MKTIALTLLLCVSALCQTQASSPPAATSVQVKPDKQQPVDLFTAQTDQRVAVVQHLDYPVAIQVQFEPTIQIDQSMPNGTATSILANPCLLAQDDHPAPQRGRMAQSTVKNTSAQSVTSVFRDNTGKRFHRSLKDDPAESLIWVEPKNRRIRDPRRQLC